MNVTEIAFTVTPVTDLKIAREFYEGTLGLKATKIYEKDGMGMIEYDIGSGTLAIGKGAPLFKPGKDGVAVALEVADFPASIAELKNKQVPFALEAIETPVCHMAVISDPDGNYLLIHKRKS